LLTKGTNNSYFFAHLPFLACGKAFTPRQKGVFYFVIDSGGILDNAFPKTGFSVILMFKSSKPLQR
jgi:hypothetical protein